LKNRPLCQVSFANPYRRIMDVGTANDNDRPLLSFGFNHH
jgi:hypothetical protein